MAERNLVPLACQICDGSWNQFSFPSAPPDIRNWFSSYEYQSPESSGLPGFLCSSRLPEEDDRETQDSPASLGKDTKEADHPVQKENERISEIFGGNLPGEHDDLGDIVLGRNSTEQETANDFCKEEVIVPRLFRKRNSYYLTGNEEDESPLIYEDKADEIIQDALDEENHDSKSCSQGEISQCESFCTSNTLEAYKEDNKPENKGSNGKDSAEKNGFVSTRNRRDSMAEGSGTFCFKLVSSGKFENSENIAGIDQVRSGIRSALADKTNIPSGAEADGEEDVAGKWRCPGRSKPYLGPPLKQLRLEKWLYRVD